MVLNDASMVFDYIVFIVLICASLGVTFYLKCAGPKEKTKADYVFATASKVSMGAMLLSFARGTLGVRSFLGYPSELYYHGSGMYEILYGMLIAYPIVAYLFVPVYYNLGITSVYQYLDLRFRSKSVRYLASGTYIFRNILNLGVTVFTPCVALKTIIGLPYWVSISGIVSISVICSMVGGLKAAIIADVVQGLIMIGCSLAIIIQGSLDTGGVDYIVRTNYEHGRLQFFNFDMDPTIRVATVSAFFGQLFMSLSIFGCQQNFVQRYCSMESLYEVRKTLWSNVPVIAVLFSLSWITGMVMFADYLHCDPLSLGFISKIDEILPFYIEDKFTHIPGLIGVFMASLFNGALSLAVSNLSSMSTVAWEDFFSKIPCFRGLSDKQQLFGIKLLNIALGLITICIAFGVAFMSGVIESSQMMTSATSGPLLGVFLLALFFPICNWKGAISGMILSHLLTIWIVFGSATVDKPARQLLPLSTDGCNNNSFSGHSFPTQDILPAHLLSAIQWVNSTDARVMYDDDTVASTSLPADKDVLTQLYLMTYMYYSLFGSAACVFFGLLISVITGTSEEDVYEEKLIHPWALKMSRLFPGKSRQYLKDTESRDTTQSDIQVTKTSADIHSSYRRHDDDFSNIEKDHVLGYHSNVILHPGTLSRDIDKHV